MSPSESKLVDKTADFISWKLSKHPDKQVRFRRRKVMEYLESNLRSALEERGYHVSKITLGWWMADEITEKLADKYGLKIITKKDMPQFHDYDSFAPRAILRAYARMWKARVFR